MTAVFEEPVGFAQWLGRHCIAAKVEVPRAGTARRLLLARVFAALTEAGMDVPVAVRGLEVGVPERALAAVWGVLVADLEGADGERASQECTCPPDYTDPACPNCTSASSREEAR